MDPFTVSVAIQAVSEGLNIINQAITNIGQAGNSRVYSSLLRERAKLQKMLDDKNLSWTEAQNALNQVINDLSSYSGSAASKVRDIVQRKVKEARSREDKAKSDYRSAYDETADKLAAIDEEANKAITQSPYQGIFNAFRRPNVHKTIEEKLSK